MDKQNKIGQPLLILGITIAILIAFSFVKINFSIAGINLTTVDLFSDIKIQPQDIQQLNQLRNGNNSRYLQKNVLRASFYLPDFGNLLESILSSSEKTSNNNTIYVTVQGRKTPITGNTKQLNYFFDALKNSKSKTVRVAHYGDSAIEGDLITADIRETMQNKFSGNGVGWLGIVSQDIMFRLTTKHTFSSNWESASLYTNNPKELPLGISGEVNVPKGNAWVQYQTTTRRSNLRDFSLVRLFYSNAKSSQIYYSFDGGAKQTANLRTGSDIQELVLKPSGKARLIRIEFPTADQAYFYGVSLEDGPGVYVDNLPLRGNTGVDLGSLKPEVLKQFAKYLDYKLIILEFGLNVAGSRQSDYSWYEREMVKVINNLKAAFPNASFLMISVPDKAMKRGSGFETDPTILTLLKTQKNIAQQANVAIWSLFDAMGGENSMPQWVDANPPLAFKDYIHFNDQGAKKVADMLTEALMSLYH